MASEPGGTVDHSGAGGPDPADLRAILAGTWIAQACYAVASLGVPDLLANGPRPVGELAAESAADEGALYRLPRALASVGLMEETEQRTFALRGVAEFLRSDSPRSARASAIIYGEEVFRSFAEIMHTARTGRPAFDEVYGKPFYSYLDENASLDHIFTAAQGALPAPAVLRTVDLPEAGTIVDIGGGSGALLAGVLAELPGATGVLVERNVGVLQARRRLADAGVADRVEFVESDFFRSVPTGGDVYVLCRILHNWNDDKALEILLTLRENMSAGSRLVLLEELVGDAERRELGERDGGGEAGSARVVDLLMLVMIEGHDRSGDEYRALLDKAGFTVTAVRPPPDADPHAEWAVEATPRSS